MSEVDELVHIDLEIDSFFTLYRYHLTFVFAESMNLIISLSGEKIHLTNSRLHLYTCCFASNIHERDNQVLYLAFISLIFNQSVKTCLFFKIGMDGFKCIIY
jgi:hypothetical protein